jgi:hypothetical protein
LKPNCPGMIIGRSSTKCLFFYADRKSKMATTAGHRLTLDPMGKMFQNASSLKPLGQLKPNCPGMIIGRSYNFFFFFYANPKSKMAATTEHRLTLDPMGKCSNMNIMRYGVNVNETTTPKSNCIRNAFFSETINQTQSKLHRNVHWIVFYKV